MDELRGWLHHISMMFAGLTQLMEQKLFQVIATTFLTSMIGGVVSSQITLIHVVDKTEVNAQAVKKNSEDIKECMRMIVAESNIRLQQQDIDRQRLATCEAKLK